MKEDLLKTQKDNDSSSPTPATKEAKPEEPGSHEDKPAESSDSSSAAQTGEERNKEENGDQQNEANTGKKDIKIEYLPLDLSSFQSTKEFVRLFKEKNLPLHILINNAAISATIFSEYGMCTHIIYKKKIQSEHFSLIKHPKSISSICRCETA